MIILFLVLTLVGYLSVRNILKGTVAGIKTICLKNKKNILKRLTMEQIRFLLDGILG